MAMAAESAQPAAARPTLEGLLFDKAAFLAALPKKTLVLADPKTRAIAPEMAQALAALGPGGVEFVPMLEGMTPPKPARRVPPQFRGSERDRGRVSQAKLLVLVGEKGRVAAVHCVRNDDRTYAIAAAAAVLKWTFEPAKLGDTPLPVLMLLPMEFTSR